MPAVDMSLEELRVYTGCSPCPKDFNGYWDRALKEMEAVESNVELVESAFQTPFAECFDLFFTGVGNARIHARLLRPRGKPSAPHPALIMFHGYTASSVPWEEKLAYAALGYTVAALDCRGQGGLSEDIGGVRGNTHHGHIIRGLSEGAEKLLFRQIFLDSAQLARIIMAMEDVDAERVGVMGASQGGALALACAALEPRVKKSTSLYPFLCDYRRVWEMDLTEYAYKELKTYFRLFDPTHSQEGEIFNCLGYIDVQNLAPRIQAEVLMGTGLIDEVCPPSTQFAAFNKIESPKEMVIYPDFGHEKISDFTDRAFQFMSGL